MHRIRTALTGLLTALLLCWPVAAAGVMSDAARWQWPLSPVPHVVRAFQAPSTPYGAGHRGVDLAGTVGQQVFAIGTGTVTFAGSVAGRGVVVVDHGALRSTYEPVTPQVHRGDRVTAGRPIATLQAVQSHCAPEICLHLGVRRGAVYIDPLSLFGALPVRLEPLNGLLAPATSTARRSRAASSAPASTSSPVPRGLVAGSTPVTMTVAGLVTMAELRRRRLRSVGAGR